MDTFIQSVNINNMLKFSIKEKYNNNYKVTLIDNEIENIP